MNLRLARIDSDTEFLKESLKTSEVCLVLSYAREVKRISSFQVEQARYMIRESGGRMRLVRKVALCNLLKVVRPTYSPVIVLSMPARTISEQLTYLDDSIFEPRALMTSTGVYDYLKEDPSYDDMPRLIAIYLAGVVRNSQLSILVVISKLIKVRELEQNLAEGSKID